MFMDISTETPDITALARLFYIAASGGEPSDQVRENALAHWRETTRSPWRDTRQPQTAAYGEDFFHELELINKNNGLTVKWQRHFSIDGEPDSQQSALAFASECFALLLHKPRTYHDFFCMKYHLSDGHVMDFPIVHPIAMDFWTLYVSRAGSGLIRLGDADSISLHAGDIVLIPPGCECVVTRGGSHWDYDWLSFRSQPKWFELLDWAFSLERPMRVTIDYEPALERLHTQMDELQSIPYQRGDINERLCNNIIENLLIRLKRLSESGLSKTLQVPPPDARVRKAVNYLLPRYRDDLTLEDIAAEVGLSPSRLNALFRQCYGTSLIKWRDRMRLQKARELLQHSTLSVGQIAEQVGYQDALYFSRRFRKEFGQSPSAIRKA